jgi:hypothetical protein
MEENKSKFTAIDDYILQFPHELISKIVKFRVTENIKKATGKIKTMLLFLYQSLYSSLYG